MTILFNVKKYQKIPKMHVDSRKRFRKQKKTKWKEKENNHGRFGSFMISC